MEIQTIFRILTSEVCELLSVLIIYLSEVGRSPDLHWLLISRVYIPTMTYFKLPNYLIIIGDISKYLMVTSRELVGAFRS